ncbi:MAG: transcriptional repressor [Mycobacteriaceae bacterium]
MSSMLEPPVGRLRNSRQVTDLQHVMVEVDGFRTAGEIFDETRQRGMKIGIATIYRNLKLFAETGMVDTVHREDGEVQYRLCGLPATRTTDGEPHHHHVVCRECGASVMVEAPEVEAWADMVAAAAGYTEVSHTVEIFGLCARHPNGG